MTPSSEGKATNTNRQVGLGAVLGHLGAVFGRLWAVLGFLGAVLGRLGAVLGPFWVVLGPPWGHLGSSWGRLRLHFRAQNGYIFGIIFGPISGHFLSNFYANSGAQNLSKMSQHGLQKPPQGAKRAKKNEFENHRFVLFFAVVWEHRPAQESSKTAEKPPTIASKGQQEPFKKDVHFLTSFLARARRLLHKKEVHDQARGALDMDHMQVQRETISMEGPTTKKRNDHTKERSEGNEHKRKSRTWSRLGLS